MTRSYRYGRFFRQGSVLAVAAAVLLAGAVGCGGAVSVPQWQQQLEHYVQQRTNGDLVQALHESETISGYPAFAAIGDANPNLAQDTVGIVLDRRHVAGSGAPGWFILLVGQIKNQRLESARLAAVRQEGRELQWVVGEPDDEALQAYHDYWEGQQMVVRSPARGFEPWPHETERYELAVDDQAITVTETRSGATWRLPLTAFAPDER